jgi:hypothetical protein
MGGSRMAAPAAPSAVAAQAAQVRPINRVFTSMQHRSCRKTEHWGWLRYRIAYSVPVPAAPSPFRNWSKIWRQVYSARGSFHN